MLWVYMEITSPLKQRQLAPAHNVCFHEELRKRQCVLVDEMIFLDDW